MIEPDDHREQSKRIGLVGIGFSVAGVFLVLLLARGGFNPPYLGLMAMMVVLAYTGLQRNSRNPQQDIDSVR